MSSLKLKNFGKRTFAGKYLRLEPRVESLNDFAVDNSEVVAHSLCKLATESLLVASVWVGLSCQLTTKLRHY